MLCYAIICYAMPRKACILIWFTTCLVAGHLRAPASFCSTNTPVMPGTTCTHRVGRCSSMHVQYNNMTQEAKIFLSNSPSLLT